MLHHVPRDARMPHHRCRPRARRAWFRSTVALAACLVLVLVSCGGSEVALDENERNLAARLREQVPFGTTTAPVETDEADCLAKAAVRSIGMDRLESAYGVTRDSIAGGLNAWTDITYQSADADTLAAATFDCIDMRRIVGGRLLAAGAANDAGAACIADAIDLKLLEQQAAVGFGNTNAGGAALEDNIDADFASVAASCGVAP